MSKHTPGPWVFGQDGYSLGNGVVYSRHPNGNPKDICTVSGWAGEKIANARLIAAAPDLLDALENCEKRLTNMVGMSDLCANELQSSIDVARAAIAKAMTGESK